jgi:hypothetical protein
MLPPLPTHLHLIHDDIRAAVFSRIEGMCGKEQAEKLVEELIQGVIHVSASWAQKVPIMRSAFPK